MAGGAHGTGGNTPKRRIALAAATTAACRACGPSVRLPQGQFTVKGGGRWCAMRTAADALAHGTLHNARHTSISHIKRPPPPCTEAARGSAPPPACVRRCPAPVRTAFDGSCCAVAACDAGAAALLGKHALNPQARRSGAGLGQPARVGTTPVPYCARKEERACNRKGCGHALAHRPPGRWSSEEWRRAANVHEAGMWPVPGWPCRCRSLSRYHSPVCRRASSAVH